MNIIKSIYNKLAGNGESIEQLRKRGVSIGENVAIFSSNIDYGHGFLVTIGNQVTITNATILTHDASTKAALGYSKVGAVTIGNNVFIGYGSIILPNVVIGNQVIVGAGSVVRENIPDNSVVCGNPAQVICSYDSYIEKNRKRMEQVPRYETPWINKTDEEKQRMKQELTGIMGFDK